jgi:hypothetical protein
MEYISGTTKYYIIFYIQFLKYVTNFIIQYENFLEQNIDIKDYNVPINKNKIS